MNKPKVLVLQGRFDTGKTTTLNHLIGLLLESGAEIKKGILSDDVNKDSAVLLAYKEKRIAVVTVGDYWEKAKTREDIIESITEGLEIINQLDKPTCDLYVFAARNWGNTVRGINGYAYKTGNPFVLYKAATRVHLETKEEQDGIKNAFLDSMIIYVNDYQAHKLKDMIEMLIFTDNK